jgi:hypothetical protein
MENTLHEMLENVEFNRLFDAYDEFCADVGDDDGDGIGEGPIDGGSLIKEGAHPADKQIAIQTSRATSNLQILGTSGITCASICGCKGDTQLILNV